jgi:hypothetical protein
MKATRLAVTALSLFALAGCEGLVDAPAPADESLSAPVAFAKPEMESQTICSHPFTTQLSFVGISWIPAYATGPQYAPYGTQIPGSFWVGPYYNSGIVDAPTGTYWFRTSFTVPDDVHQVTLAGLVHADNQATLYLNGKEFWGQQPVVAYPNFQDPADAFLVRRSVERTNEVRIELVNGGTEPNTTALNFCFTVTYRDRPDVDG